MDIRIHGHGPSIPFLGACDLFETEYTIERPVEVQIREDPDERTWVGHDEDRHVLNISRQAATSAMARELTLHELAHMHRHEQAHPSHTQSTDEALFLALSGRQIERRKLAHCYQIANHMKDIYADDITFDVGPTDKLVSFLESQLAAAIADQPRTPQPQGERATASSDPEITTVNAAFALALVERHNLIGGDHRLYELADAAAEDAPDIDLSAFKHHFASLGPNPDESEYRRTLVNATQEYAIGISEKQATD